MTDAAALAAWWKFDESAAESIPDASGNGHTLTATGSRH